MTKTYPFKPDWALPPGALIRERCECLNWTVKELARRMKRPYSQVSRLLNGHIQLTADTAMQLEGVFKGSPAIYWLNLESHYRLQLARGCKKVEHG